MDSLEQAREALIWYENNAAGCRLIHSGGDAHRNALAADGGTRAREALAALSRPVEGVKGEPRAFLVTGINERHGRIIDARKYDPRRDDFWMPGQKERHTVEPLFLTAPPVADSEAPSTPVDGAGAEPVAYEIFRNGVFEEVSRIALNDADKRAGYTQRPLYAAPLANPEAEARLRERVVELEREQNYPLFRQRAKELVEHWQSLDEPAEARLAQAERGPAVTEAVVETVGEELFSRGHTKITKQDVRAALEAALHPQSAAGEEGK